MVIVCRKCYGVLWLEMILEASTRGEDNNFLFFSFLSLSLIV